MTRIVNVKPELVDYDRANQHGSGMNLDSHRMRVVIELSKSEFAQLRDCAEKIGNQANREISVSEVLRLLISKEFG